MEKYSVIALAGGISKRFSKAGSDLNKLLWLVPDVAEIGKEIIMGGKPFFKLQLENIIKALKESKHFSGELIIVAGIGNYREIREICQSYRVPGIEIRVAYQSSPKGMGNAVIEGLSCLSQGNSVLIIGLSDFLNFKIAFKALEENIERNNKSGFILAYQLPSGVYFPGGYMLCNNGRIKKIIEKPEPSKVPSNLVNIVFHYHPSLDTLFNAIGNASTSRDDLYEVAISNLFKEQVYFVIPYNDVWIPIKYPGDFLRLDEYLLKNYFKFSSKLKHFIKGKKVRYQKALLFGSKVSKTFMYDAIIVNASLYNCHISNSFILCHPERKVLFKNCVFCPGSFVYWGDLEKFGKNVENKVFGYKNGEAVISDVKFSLPIKAF